MAYERIDVNHNPEGNPWVKIGCHARPNGYEQIKITISRSIVKHLGIAGGDKLEVFKGTGDHDGWIGLVKGPEGFGVTDYRQGHGNLSIRMSCRFIGVEGIHKTTKIECDDIVATTGKDGSRWLYVYLPTWARDGEET